MHKLTQSECNQYLPATVCRILSVSPNVAVPQPSENIFRVDFVSDSDYVHVKWLGELPNKCLYFIIAFMTFYLIIINDFYFTYISDPELLTKLLKAIDEKLLNDFVLNKQIRVLVEEWKKYSQFALITIFVIFL